MKVLLVEGSEDKRVVPWLVEAAGIPWNPDKTPIVEIVHFDGVEALLRPGEIETQLKRSRLSALGVLVDADESVSGRWDSIRARLGEHYPNAPSTMPPQGVVLRREGKPSFGAWVMPDNVNRGMLETFLMYLRPHDNQPLLDLSAGIVSTAKSLGAPFSDRHLDKAQIHSWLAWQNPPGRQLHNAIMEKMLTNQPPHLQAFISWFRDLYGVQ